MHASRRRIDIDAVLHKITKLAKRTVQDASEISVTLLQGDNAYTAARR